MNILPQRLRFLGTLLALIGLVACASLNPPTPPNDQDWLKKQPCAAPCWEGITPGVTTAEDAFKILQQNAYLSDQSFKLRTGSPRNSSISWHWNGTEINGEADFDGTPAVHVIQMIRITLINPVQVKDVTAVFGNPDYVSVDAEYGTDTDKLGYDMYLYFIRSGFRLLLVNNPPDLAMPIITPETPVNYITFFPASLDGLATALRRDKTTLQVQLIPWQGTLDFETYCKLEYKSDTQAHCK